MSVASELVDREADVVEQRRRAFPTVAAATEAAEHAQAEGVRAAGDHDRQLSFERRCVEAALAGDDGVGAAAGAVEVEDVEHAFRAVDQLGPEREQLRAQTSGGAGAWTTRQAETREAFGQNRHVTWPRPFLGPEDAGGVGEI